MLDLSVTNTDTDCTTMFGGWAKFREPQRARFAFCIAPRPACNERVEDWVRQRHFEDGTSMIPSPKKSLGVKFETENKNLRKT